MKIFSADQIRTGDRFTIEHEPISGIDLMERAARRCASALLDELPPVSNLLMVCGPGNNGGDGLVMARILRPYFSKIYVVCLGAEDKRSPDFSVNLERLRHTGIIPLYITEPDQTILLSELLKEKDMAVGDALFGTGLSKPVTDPVFSGVIEAINQSGLWVFSVDIPSGLFADSPSDTPQPCVVKADITFTFEQPKLSFLFAEHFPFTGKVRVVPIGIHDDFKNRETTPHFLLTASGISELERPINPFSHKGTFGHAGLLAGSVGKAGAAVLAAKACVKSGAGLSTLLIPSEIMSIVQESVPEVMAEPAGDGPFIGPFRFNPEKFSALGIGPGIGTESETVQALKNVLAEFSGPLILDADALNILAENKTWLSFLPPNMAVLTPHPKEFDRLTMAHTSGMDRWKTQVEFSVKYNCFVVLKGRYTSVTTPSGKSFFNTSGNPGMATGGSGDVLTGILTGLSAQGMPLIDAVLQGVYLHGLAGDLAFRELGREGVTAGEIITYLPNAFQTIFSKKK